MEHSHGNIKIVQLTGRHKYGSNSLRNHDRPKNSTLIYYTEERTKKEELKVPIYEEINITGQS